jgi:predicted ATPase
MLRAWLASEEEERVPTVAAKLASRLQSLQLGPATEAGLALLLNLESGNPESADPVAAYVSWLEALAAQRPTVVALDDMHWLEPSSAVLAVQLAELAMRLPLLFVATLRPEQASRGWHVRTSARIAHPSRARETALAPLTDEQARELVADLAPDADAATAGDVVRRAEGNPLFVEQLLRARREGAVLASGPGDLRTVATARLLPPALAGVFVGRIDRLPTEARVVAQTAAAVGRTFRRDLLARMLDERTIDAAMPALSEAGIVVEHEPPPDQSWSFTHALLRDAVLSTLVRSRRRQIFNDVAAAFEQAAIEAGEDRLELLAYYYARSDDRAKALEYHERAAARALRVGAGAEAAEWLAQARQLAEQLGDETAAARIAARLGGVVTPAPGSP